MSSRGQAIRRYRLFNGLPPREEGEFIGLEMPSSVFRAGDALEILYRSSKRDPSTDSVPSKPVDYIHDHGRGVGYYRTDGGGSRVSVPRWLANEQHLALIGDFLGAAYCDARGEDIEVKSSRPYPRVFTIPSGKALVIVDEFKPKIVALVWGGKLGVFRRGIVG